MYKDLANKLIRFEKSDGRLEPMHDKDIYLAVEFQKKECFENEFGLAMGLELAQGWNYLYAKEIADLAWSRMHAENNPSPPSDTADTRLRDLILELDSSGNLLPVLRGLPSDVWFKLFNAVETVGNGD